MAKNVTITVKGKAFIKGGGREGNTSREIKGIMAGVARELKEEFTQKIANKAAKAAAEVVLAKSQEYVPVKTGLLQESGRIKKIKEGTWSVGYGANGSGLYATIVHEDLTQDKNRTAPVGSKFITRAAQDTQKEQQAAINKVAKENMKKIGK